jgi:hypothetical protein
MHMVHAYFAHELGGFLIKRACFQQLLSVVPLTSFSALACAQRMARPLKYVEFPNI